jgi:hypothetical protein
MNRFALVLSALLFGTASLASADGVYLSLKPETPRLEVVATVDARLPGSPVFLVDEGNGMQPLPGSDARALESNGSKVTPGRPLKHTYELTLAGPGTYKVRARYQINNRVTESNKATITVE